jgi:hypothetical protein
MHLLAFGEKAKYPKKIKYLRPVRNGRLKDSRQPRISRPPGSSRCADTRQCSLILANTSSTSEEGDHLISVQSLSVV